MIRTRLAAGALCTSAFLLTACTSGQSGPRESSPAAESGVTAAPTSSAPASAAPSSAPTGAPAPAPTPMYPTSGEPLAGGLTGPQQVAADAAAVTTVANNLEAPWSIVRLPATVGGGTLVDERDTGVIKEILPDGSAGAIGTVPGVAAAGEGGLLGVEPYLEGAQLFLYAYETTATDNRVIRMPVAGGPGAFSLGAASDVLTGIPKASNHNGGRIEFGPDGMLYITAGDASQSANAQDVNSLSGKILRVTPTGAVPGDNPFAGSPVYSLGHRNPQGITWAADGTMYAAEFGQDTWDELNIITPGSNYGWPTVEGITTGAPSVFVNPIYEWATDDASPSGLVMLGDTLFMAGLGGTRLWSITVSGPVSGTSQQVAVTSAFDGTFGRLRDVAPGPESTLLMLTNNTDGRGSPGAGDDRLLSVPLQTASG